MFPVLGHAHPSFFRNADVTARLDVRPWPVINHQCWPQDCDHDGQSWSRYWSANAARYAKGASRSPYSGKLRENTMQLLNIDFERVEARIRAWAELHGGEISL